MSTTVGHESDSDYAETIRVGREMGRLYQEEVESDTEQYPMSGLFMKEWMKNLMVRERSIYLGTRGLALVGFTYGPKSCKHCGVLRKVYPVSFTRRDHCSDICYELHMT